MGLAQRRFIRTATAVSLCVGMLFAAAPAGAKAPPARLTVHAAVSFRVASLVSVTGIVTPTTSSSVTLQRLVGKTWTAVAHAKPNAAGAFVLLTKAATKPAKWQLRAVRAKSGSSKALTSNVITVQIVKTAFSVGVNAPATVTNGSPIIVTGTVKPKASGSVLLQANSGGAWLTVSTGTLSNTSAFTVSVAEPLGSYQLRVVKAATRAVAGGISNSFTVGVIRPPLVVTTQAIAEGTVALPYTAQLAASGGLPPYAWSVVPGGLPSGVTMSSSGLLTGTAARASVSSFTVTVSDSSLASATAVLSLRFVLSPDAANFVSAWGDNSAALFGNGTVMGSNVPVLSNGLPGVTATAACITASYEVRYDGSVYGWGADSSSQLGDNAALSATGVKTPVLVAGLPPMTQIACGELFAIGLAADGTVWTWGDNTDGQIGDGTVTLRGTPYEVAGLTGIASVAAGFGSSYALKSDGTLLSWGLNIYGQLGLNTVANVAAPTPVPGLTDVKAIAADFSNASALKEDGTVWSWGFGDEGRLGNGASLDSPVPVQTTRLSGITAVVVSGTGAFALGADGSVWGWGANFSGAIGDGTATMRTTPVRVLLSASAKAVSASASVSGAILADGTVRMWGAAAAGELGNGTNSTSLLPVAVTGLTNVTGLSVGTHVALAVSSR